MSSFLLATISLDAKVITNVYSQNSFFKFSPPTYEFSF